MCLEVKVDIRDWVYFIPVLQLNLNHTPVPSLANKAPVEVFCVLPASSPLDFGFNIKDNTSIELGTSTQQIESTLEQLRARVQEKHKKRAKEANFDVNDYVLRSRVDQKHNDKLRITWIGPYQVIIGTEEHSFRIQHLVAGAKSDVHASRLKFYADTSFEVTEEIHEHMAAQGIVLTVGELKERRWNSAKMCYDTLVGWKDLEPIEDSCEPLSSLYKDIPVMVKQYIAASSDVQLPVPLGQLQHFKLNC
ncbi:hypothetical protein PHPALM_27757 [Phytophthora palmivora]|uniref:Chromo domain-containing protein n=1 Tax=Phytophthora palmivora TaxID=4796 RepID=A0A2P4XBS8_9STRA|nr:hypothetical protein PHPALM_27757 [Phytophthora palmivora]